MSESMRTLVEVIFNLSYLIVVWALVVMMVRRQSTVAPENLAVAKRVMGAFALLALGDTGHVGFRVLAYANGGLDANPTLVGLGALATAITVTFFYALMLDVWRLRFHKKWDWFAYILLGAAVIRLILMALPQNEWGNVVPPQPFGIYRNLPLIVQGLGVMILILRDAAAAKDRTFLWIGAMIFVSYAFYTPVILWVQQSPLLGMLMIPKTLAYVAIAVIAYRELYGAPSEAKLKAANA
ncbi:MAG: hypothetical protein U0559_09735 [Anaerolineae bacterium]